MLGWCWASIVDNGPKPAQHWVNASCFLGNTAYGEGGGGYHWSQTANPNFRGVLAMPSPPTRDIDLIPAWNWACVVHGGPTTSQLIIWGPGRGPTTTYVYLQAFWSPHWSVLQRRWHDAAMPFYLVYLIITRQRTLPQTMEWLDMWQQLLQTSCNSWDVGPYWSSLWLSHCEWIIVLERWL